VTRAKAPKASFRRRYGYPPIAALAAQTLDQFCEKWDISRSTYEGWRKAGRAPAELQPMGPGGRIFITAEAERAWVAARTGPAACAD